MESEAAEKLKEPEENVQPGAATIDVPIGASISIEISDSNKLLLEAYRKLTSVRNNADEKDLEGELTDRNSNPPGEFETLSNIALEKFKTRKLRMSVTLTQYKNVRIGRIDAPETIQMSMGNIYKRTE